MLMLARTCSKLWRARKSSQSRIMDTRHADNRVEGYGTIAISPISASRCCSKYDLSRVPVADGARGWEAMRAV